MDQGPNEQAVIDQMLMGGGEMGELIRSFDWAQTPLGPIDSWSSSLRMMVRLLLVNRFPLLLWWGPQFIQIYNDAYSPILGVKHPKRALGLSVSECWSEIWHILKPLIETPFQGGPSTWSDDILLEINRYGFTEESHFTIAYSPVPDETMPNLIGGVLATVHEITEKVVGERRQILLKELGTGAVEMKTTQEACDAVGQVLAKHAQDVPFALIYLLDADGTQANLACAAGVRKGGLGSPLDIDLSNEVWPLSKVISTEQAQTVDKLVERFGADLPQGPWSDPPQQAVVLPIRSNIAHQLTGILIVGVSSRLKLDALYLSFFELVASQIATAIANARAYEAERQRAEGLAELDRAKTVFFNNISHEFRTPLTLMLAPMEDSLSSGTPVLEGEAFHMAHRNVLRLLRLVNTLLDFSRLEAGRIDASYQPVDLPAFTTELASMFRSSVEKAGLEYVVECSPLSEQAYIDVDMWEKIVLNLLANALKYTFTGSIHVTLREVDNQVHLQVRDTGTGIPADELPHIFERFHRVKNARSRTYEGTGIGLSLVRELVLLHGGDVQVTSVVDEGSCFTITIPLGRSHLPADRIGAQRSRASTAVPGTIYIDEALRWSNIVPDTVEPPAPLPSSSVIDGGQSAYLLLVDDNADMLAYLTQLLSQHYRVEGVADGLAALAATREHRPDLVLTDVMMPGMDGFELLKALKSDPHTQNIPVMILSARAGEEASIEGLQAGADDYLIKPFTARELLSRINANLRLARLHEAIRQSEEQHRWLLENTTEAIWRFDVKEPVPTDLPEDEQIERYYQTGFLATCNEGMARMYGFSAASDMVGIRLTDIMPPTETQNIAYLRAFIQAGYRLLDTESVEVDNAGHTKYILNNLVGLIERGAITGAWGTSRDITARKLAENALRANEAHMRTLAQAGTILMSSFDYDAALNTFARLLVPEFADSCAISVVEAGSSLRCIAVAAATPDKEKVVWEMLERYPQSVSQITIAQALETQQAVIAEVNEDFLKAYAYDADHANLIRFIGSNWVLRMPLIGRTGLIGILSMGMSESGRRFTENDLPFAEELAKRVSLAIDNMRLYAEAQHASELRDEFLSVAAHELKTPVTSLRGFAQILLRRFEKYGAVDSSELQHALKTINDQSIKLSQFLSRLLDVSRFEAGRLTLEREATDLGRLIQDIANTIQQNTDRHTIAVDVPLPLTASVDPLRLEQVLVNLLDNAVKYSPDGGTIEVKATQEGEAVHLSVTDHGMGIPLDRREHLFDRFYQAHRIGKFGGMGLGLYVSRQIVQMHGGQIVAEFPEEGGTRFVLTLPTISPN